MQGFKGRNSLPASSTRQAAELGRSCLFRSASSCLIRGSTARISSIRDNSGRGESARMGSIRISSGREREREITMLMNQWDE